ncbi:MAG: class I adenylate-forming enzyme family protein [Myxococcota bacterium]|nr:class I adenylate-forming enzyme family protein [Myxococcota bacterium]
MLVPDLLRSAAQAHPERVAVRIDGCGELTYGQWECDSNRFARHLVERGIEPGSRVALSFSNLDGLLYLRCWFGIHKAGGVAVPTNPRATARELEHVLAHAEVSLVLAGSESADRLAGVLPPGAVLLRRSEVEAAWAEGESAEFQVPRPADALADILYTSGTTGLPKGVACTHENITFKGSSELHKYFQGARYLHAVPLFTFAGSHAMTLMCLRGCMTQVIQPAFEPGRFLEILAEQKAALSYAVPTMLLRCLEHPRLLEGGFDGLRLLMYGTAPMPPAAIQKLAQHFTGTFLVNLYGLTEGGAAVCTLPPQEALARPDSIGKPLPPTELKIVDEAGEELEAGLSGEICMKSVSTGRSYFRDEGATQKAWRDGWLHTGDIGYLDGDGYLYLVDRKKDLIIVGGHNVSAPEVEAALLDHPDVAEAAVIGLEHPGMGAVPRAFVVCRGEVSTHPEELQAFLEERLVSYKVPRTYTFVDELPRNALGKVLKRELRREGASA